MTYLMLGLRSIFLLILIALAPLIAFSQQPSLRNYTVDDGLPSSEVYHVIQDSKGYVWFATNMGVSRFDGRSFRNFDVQNGLPENTVFEIYEDSKQRLWFVCFPFQLAYYENDSIYQYKYNSELKEVAGHGLIPIKKSFYVSQSNDVYFSFITGRKIFRLNDSGKFDTILDISKTNSYIAFYKIGNQILIAQNGEQSNRNYITYLHDTIRKYYLKTIVPPKGFSYGNVIAQINEGNDLLFVRNNTVHRLVGNQVHSFDIGDRILWMNLNSDGTFWIGKESDGVELYSFYQSKIKMIENYLSGIAVSSVLTDNEEGVWFTTLGSGVFYMPTKAFVSYTKSDGLLSENIPSIEIFNNELYIGTDNYDLQVFDGSIIKTLKNFDNDNKTINILKSFYNSKLWIGAKTNLFSFDGQNFSKISNNHLKLLQPEIKRDYIFSVKDIFPIDSSNILVGQMRSLSKISSDQVIYDSYLDDKVSLRVEVIEKDHDGSYLLGTFNGLWKYNNGIYTNLSENSELLNRRITDIVILGMPDSYIVGTKGFGLVVKLKDEIFKTYPVRRFIF